MTRQPAPDTTGAPGRGGVPRWPLLLIASPAAVAVWSGWIGLGGLCGFGIIHPLPGIWEAARVNTAITLPVGVEAYGAYALGAWLAPGAAGPARTFARRSAIGALVLGMAGQVAYHLLSAAHADRAPWPVVVLVSCLPVVTLGFGAALTHLLRGGHTPAAGAPATGTAPAPEAGALAPGAPRALTAPAPGDRTHPPRARASTRTACKPGTAPVSDQDAEMHFATALATGELPSRRRIKAELHTGQDRAAAIYDHLSAIAAAPRGTDAEEALR